GECSRHAPRAVASACGKTFDPCVGTRSVPVTLGGLGRAKQSAIGSRASCRAALVAEPPTFFAWARCVRGAADVAIAIAAVVASCGNWGHQGLGGRQGSTAANGVCDDSQWREPGCLVAKGRGERI